MRAAVILGPGRFELKGLEPPLPGPREVRVKLQGCGICGSNLPLWQGRPWFEYPLPPGSPGHEGWGIIDALGDGTSGFREGERVGLVSTHSFAEYDIASAEEIVSLPSELEGKPFPAEPLGCALNVFRRSDVKPGQTVAIIGIGFLGALVGTLVKSTGARLIGISRRSFALDRAASLGATHCIHFRRPEDVVTQVMQLTKGEGCARVIEAVGHQITLDVASQVVKPGGKLIIAGYHQDGVRTVDLQSWNWKGIDVINAHERDRFVIRRGIRQAIDSVIQGKLDPFPLFTHSFAIEELRDAFEVLSNRPHGFMKALISYE